MEGKARRKKGGGEVAFPFTNMESNTRYEALVKEAVAPFTSPVSIHIHSKRKREVDADGVSGKAVIDGLVYSGLLEDDRPQYVKEITYSQEKIPTKGEEETIITIMEVEDEGE